MSTGRYVLTLCQRATLILAVAVLAAVLSVFVGRGQVPVWTSSTTFLVGPGDAPQSSSLGAASALARTTLPSLARVATSAEVLTGAEVQLGIPTGSLAGAVSATVPDGLSFLEVSVTAPDADSARSRAQAVSDAFQTAVRELTGPVGAEVSVVDPPHLPRWPSGPAASRLALFGGVAGAGVTALLLGLAEARRPRFRSRQDGRVAGVPVVVHPWRADDVGGLAERLTWHLAPADARHVAQALATSSSGRPVGEVATKSGTVLVVRAGRASQARVRARLAGCDVVVLTAGRLFRWSDAVADRFRHLLGERRGNRRAAFAAVVPAAALFIVGVNPQLPGNLKAAALVSLALAPVWLGHLPRYRGARLLLGSGLIALLSGALLALIAGADHEWSRSGATAQAMVVLGGLGTIGIVCWARTVMPLWALPLVFGAGLLVGAVPAFGSSVNPVKFLLVLPLSIIVLALCDALDRRWAAVAACGALAVLCLVNDGRSSMAFLLATGAVLLWQGHRSGRRPLNRVGIVAAIGAAGAGGYVLLTDLLVSGTLGEGIAERSRQQVDQSGSLLLGGRPEWSATVELMIDRPTGFGLGTIPTGADVMTVKQGFAPLRIPTADGYIENYLTNGGFELHSILADLWVWLGIPGLAVGLLMVGLVVRGLVEGLATSRAPAVLVLLGTYTLWFLAFGPIPSNMPEVALTIGLCLLPARHDCTHRPLQRDVSDPGHAARAVQPVVSR